MIRLEGLGRQFGAQVLFERLDWAITDQARLGLVGPNGAGKTTLLRILAGRDQPDAGRLHRPRNMTVGYLPQSVESVEGESVLGVVLAGLVELAGLERELTAASEALAALAPDDPEAARLTAVYGDLRQRFEALDGDRAETRARMILSGLGVPESSFGSPLETLSGGWRMRVVLARLLLGTPGLLLLDEPTNHLDLESIAWLEEYLAGYAGAYVVVSHDRYFLNRVARGIVELEAGKLTAYTGDYEAYIAARELRTAQLEKAARHQARERAKTERFIERFRYKNTKAKAVQSRIRALGKVDKIETARTARRIRFGFPPAPRSGDIVVRAEGVDKRYGDVEVYREMDLLLRRGDRVALVGPNGSGKSTLVKLLSGQTDVTAGRLELGHNVTVHHYSQHQLEALNPENTVLGEIEQVVDPGERPRMRNLLGGFLFEGAAVDKRVSVLSGGEKARLALAKMLVRPANLLLLDEPTNHLDLPSREVLENALNEYGGTLVVVSHDRYFINRVVTAVAAVGDGKLVLHEGDYDEYLVWQADRLAEAPQPVTTDPDRPAADRERRREMRRQEAEERNRRYREQEERRAALAPLEGEIAKLEARLVELDRLQASPEVYSDPDRSKDLARERADIDARLARLYAEWEAAAD